MWKATTIRFSVWPLAGLLLGLWTLPAGAQTSPPPAPGPRPTCYALIVAGQGGSPVYQRRFDDWTQRFVQVLTQAGVPARQIITLRATGPQTTAEQPPALAVSAANIRAKLDELAARMAPEDQFIFVALGHGTTEPQPALILPGPDLPLADLAEKLAGIPARNQVVLMFNSNSGAMIAPLAHNRRVLITATGPTDTAEPVYAEFFLRALESREADGHAPLPLPPGQAPPVVDPAQPSWRSGARDGRVSLLEAYNWAAHQTAMWIMRQKADATGEAWVVEGRQSVEIFKKLCTGAANDPAARKLSPQSRADVPDAVVPLKMKDVSQVTPWWINRRTVNEHAHLEDCGKTTAMSALRGTGYEPLDGLIDDQPGQRARRVYLGQPALEAAPTTVPAVKGGR